MKLSRWLVALLLAIGAVNFSGCSSTPEVKPLSEEEKKKIDDDMRKAIDLNKSKKGK